MFWIRTCAVATALLVDWSTHAPTARADDALAVAEPTPLAAPQISPRRRVGAVFAAIVPGFVLRGTGSFLVHERRTARRLAKVTAIGLGGMVVGGAPIGLTAANPYTVAGVPLLVAGAGLFFTSWWADIAVAAGIRTPGSARAAPPWSLELGTTWLHDAYRERGYMRVAGRVELGRVGVAGTTLIDSEGRSGTGELDVRVRILGPAATGKAVHDGSRLLVRTGLRLHRDAADRVTLATSEIELLGRYDLDRLDRVLDGTFAELWTGLGVERATYPNGDHDNSSLLLGGFAWGMYLGERGEATVFYDHRRDTLAGGIAAFRAAGFVGSLGGALDVLVGPRWAVRAQLEVGSAYVTTVALRYQGGSQ